MYVVFNFFVFVVLGSLAHDREPSTLNYNLCLLNFVAIIFYEYKNLSKSSPFDLINTILQAGGLTQEVEYLPSKHVKS
jgi:hypothetical protein